MTYQIDHNVPLPPTRQGRHERQSKYDWAKMAVGDSFFVPSGSDQAARFLTRDRLANAAIRYGSRHGTKYAVREDFDDKANPGVRVWRIA